ncbi:transcriptional regulator LeuO [Serratia proteamaculans]|uniref:transcriptional regulator LeuO n=1 Tax=Serratia proteamaculans TaxID=28151 RepID=UPI000D94C185|nr:transcriptional regulator LeuO [Serratia proteamaculans]SPZ53178.1 HTH-type transcriptional regulator LeuO [Serratia quinivorans]NWA72767.1 transcriptional regulator LeuO [Serratia proteamaculans]CAI0916462.1 HTH-type transcriptional regulator LeuO [Serratia proteamaculans]CAI0976893.1 HTH-type transcriptional regulator LeuO [Serratia proteamaculans]CAI1559310.1 HTH-type transcriptional regulator LeuO [Serratia proteamaculans]
MSEYNSEIITEKETSDLHLRSVDLNLLTVFDAVMQMQNITRAASFLGMSQPAVSNAVARLKLMFNDELFVRCGRGIQPTVRARQLFGPVRQALQLVQNELPGAEFEPFTSERVFSIAICSPLDLRLGSALINHLKEIAPQTHLKIKSYITSSIDSQLRYQEVEFVIGYTCFESAEFKSVRLFEDELVLALAKKHPRIEKAITPEQILGEQHAVVSLDIFNSFSKPYYIEEAMQRVVAQQCTDLYSVLNMVSNTDMIAIVPAWLAQQQVEALQLRFIPFPCSENKVTCYLSWHESAERDKGHLWMKGMLGQSDMSE